MSDTSPRPYMIPADLRPVIAQLRELEESIADRRRRLGELATAPPRRRAEGLSRLRLSLARVEAAILREIRDGIAAAAAAR